MTGKGKGTNPKKQHLPLQEGNLGKSLAKQQGAFQKPS